MKDKPVGLTCTMRLVRRSREKWCAGTTAMEHGQEANGSGNWELGNGKRGTGNAKCEMGNGNNETRFGYELGWDFELEYGIPQFVTCQEVSISFCHSFLRPEFDLSPYTCWRPIYTYHTQAHVHKVKRLVYKESDLIPMITRRLVSIYFSIVRSIYLMIFWRSQTVI